MVKVAFGMQAVLGVIGRRTILVTLRGVVSLPAICRGRREIREVCIGTIGVDGSHEAGHQITIL